MVKRKDVLAGIPTEHGMCELCGKEKAVWKDLEKGKPVKVCDPCAHRPIGNIKKAKKKLKTGTP